MFSIREEMDLCEWLMSRGLGLGEAANLIVYMEQRNSFGKALCIIYEERKLKIKEIHDQQKANMSNMASFPS